MRFDSDERAEIIKRIRKHEDDIAAFLYEGGCEDFSQYKYMTGQLAAVKTILHIIQDVRESINNQITEPNRADCADESY